MKFLFFRYRIDAITLKGVVSTNSPSISPRQLTEVITAAFRSVNNLLEHFHQSFFFYILPTTDRYISIGIYVPVTICFALTTGGVGLNLWFVRQKPHDISKVVLSLIYSYLVPALLWGVFQFTPVVSAIVNWPPMALFGLSVLISLLIPLLGLRTFNAEYSDTHSSPFITMKSLLLLASCCSLATLTFLNFSLSFFIGSLTAIPFALMRKTRFKLVNGFQFLLLFTMSPLMLGLVATILLEVDPMKMMEFLLLQQEQQTWLILLLCTFYWPLIIGFQLIVLKSAPGKVKRKTE